MSYKNYLKKYSDLPIQVKASFWFLVSLILQKGINIIVTPIFTRLMPPEIYGEYSLYTSWEGLIAVFVTLRLSYGVYTQGLIKFDYDKNKFANAIQGLSTLIVFTTFVIYLLFSDYINKLLGLNTYQMISMFVTLWTGEIFNFWLCEKRVVFEYKLLVLISVIVALIIPLAGIFSVIYFDDPVTARIMSIAIVNCIFYFPFLIKKIKSGEPFISKKYWAYALKFNLPLIPHYLSQTILSKADNIMIAKMVGVDKAGIYNLSYSLALVLLIFNSAIVQVMTPWIYTKIKNNLTKEISRIAYIALICIASINFLLILFTPEIIKIFAPKEFYEAIWVIPPIAMSTVFIFSYDLFSTYQFYHEKTTFVMIASVSVAALNVILNYICIDKFGYLAAGYTTLVCYMLYSLGHYMFMKNICKVYHDGVNPYKFKNLAYIYIIFLTLSFSIMLTYKIVLIRMIIVLLIIIFILYNKRKIITYIREIINIRTV